MGTKNKPKTESNRQNPSGTLKVTGGVYRGRRLTTPGGATHPMGERERLALFNMLRNDLAGRVVLDAFAGSGALGIEALSRGAEKVIFVEKNAEACKIIRQNLEALAIPEEKYTVTRSDAAIFRPDERYNLVLLDPPYDKFEMSTVQHLARLLQDDGTLVLSHPEEAPELTGLLALKTHQYAAAHLTLYRKD